METILIQNFKAIKNTAKREIKVANLTILMGEQATGKSTVAKLVYFFKKLPEEIMFDLIKNSDSNEENFERKLFKSVNRFFSNLFYLQDRDNSFLITYQYRNTVKISIEKFADKNELNISWPSKGFVTILNEKWISYSKSISESNNEYDPILYAENERVTMQLVKTIGNIFGYNQRAVYVPASRNVVVSLEEYIIDIFAKIENYSSENSPTIISENIYIIKSFIKHIQSIKNKFRIGGFSQMAYGNQVNDESRKLLREFIDLAEVILVGKYEYVDSGERLYVNNMEKYVFLENASSGQQEAIRIIQDIFLEVLENRPVFRVYEEPESHLSPVGQLGIIQLIAMLANRNPDNQIIIPTHTPYLLREVSNMMKASKIVKDNPDLKEEVSKILKPFYWLDMQSVSAYQLTREGEIEDAKDEEYQMIDGELFDRVTNDISDQLDRLLSLQYE